jgi:hypothetical protein
MIGDPLGKALKDALHKANLVLLIYTSSDRDWSYCMWECGVATDPIEENTRIVVFQCTDDKPEPFGDQVRTRITEQDIFNFAKQFHKDRNFFPGEPPYDSQIEQRTLQTRSGDLYKALRGVVPTGSQKPEDIHRWDYLTLQLDKDFVGQVKKMRGERNRKRGLDIIENNLLVIDGFGLAPKHFGFGSLEKNVKFSEYVRRWREGVGENVPTEWISAFCAGIWEAIRNVPAEPTWERFRSARAGTSWWFFPVLNNARRLPDNKMEFDFYLYRVPEPN